MTKESISTGNRQAPEIDIPTSLISLLDQMTDPFSIKNLDSRYLYVNPAALRLFGVKRLDDVVGKLDNEIKSRLVEFDNAAEEFKRGDMDVFRTRQNLSTLEIHPLAVDYPYLGHRIPWKSDEGDCIGVMAYIRKLEVYTLNDFINGHMPGSLLLNKPDDFFTERECEIMFYRLQGLKTKEVAERLNLAEKTISNYMQLLYEKAGVSHFDDFREFCRKKNYDRYLPRRFIFDNPIDFAYPQMTQPRKAQRY
ncbi:helix-turn-helix transcriptional regulator [Martelella alba]|uniref:Helix-turn-helix transcriptional regulator n=2 Tax=Martelella alba TaxID=2590451 RepID=A0ABY2SN40_9HYPH|nr:helix-turn-helix transcriptional regulator [Martelella alba]